MDDSKAYTLTQNSPTMVDSLFSIKFLVSSIDYNDYNERKTIEKKNTNERIYRLSLSFAIKVRIDYNDDNERRIIEKKK